MKTKEMRRAERKERIYDKIKESMVSTQADKLVWDLSKEKTDEYRDIEGHPRLAVVQFVGEILSEFDFPISPKLFYAGMRRESGAGNRIDEGRLWVRAELISATGIKDEFTIPIEVSNGRMLPPSLIINDGNVNIIAQSTFDDILGRITTYKDIPFRRNMFSPGPEDKENYPPYNKDWPKTQVLKKDMFTPFASKQDAIRSAMTGIVQGVKTPEEKADDLENDPGLLDPNTKQYIEEGFESDAAGELYNPFESDPEEEGPGWPDTRDDQLDMVKYMEERGVTPEESAFPTGTGYEVKTPEEEAMETTESFQASKQAQLDPVRMEAKNKGYQDAQMGKPKDPQYQGNEDYEQGYKQGFTTKLAQVSHDNYLDESERDNCDYLMPGEKIKLKGEVLVRNRGGGLYRIPSGAAGEIIRDIDGTGRMFYASFDNLKAWVTVHQIEGKKHPRDRQDREYNEGYSQASERPEELE